MMRWIAELLGTRSRPVTREAVSARLGVEALEERRVPAVNFAALASQLATYLASIEPELHTHFDTAIPLPGVGKTISQLTTVDDHVIELRGDLNSVLTKPGGYANDGELTAALNTALAGWTDKVFTVSPFDANSTGLTLTLIDVSRDDDSGPAETATLQTGLPGLPLWIKTPPAVEVHTGAGFENLVVNINGNNVSINSAQQPATFKVSVLGGLAAGATFEGVVGMLPVVGEDNGTA